MVPKSWKEVCCKKEFNRPDTYVKWIIDLAVEAGYLPSSGNANWGAINGDILDQIDLINLPISTFNNDVGFLDLETDPIWLSDKPNYVPKIRSITINGITKDLSLDQNWIIAGGGGGSLTDGNYGGVTVSGGGTVININSNLNANVLADGSISNLEFQHLNGLDSNIQNQINTIKAEFLALSVAL